LKKEGHRNCNVESSRKDAHSAVKCLSFKPVSNKETLAKYDSMMPAIDENEVTLCLDLTKTRFSDFGKIRLNSQFCRKEWT